MIDSYSLGMTGTFASFAKILALQHQDVVGSEIYGANFSGFEINMQYYSSLYMKGAVVLQTDNGQKSCDSELRRIAGMYVSLFQDLHIASDTTSILYIFLFCLSFSCFLSLVFFCLFVCLFLSFFLSFLLKPFLCTFTQIVFLNVTLLLL